MLHLDSGSCRIKSPRHLGAGCAPPGPRSRGVRWGVSAQQAGSGRLPHAGSFSTRQALAGQRLRAPQTGKSRPAAADGPVSPWNVTSATPSPGPAFRCETDDRAGVGTPASGEGKRGTSGVQNVSRHFRDWGPVRHLSGDSSSVDPITLHSPSCPETPAVGAGQPGTPGAPVS